ncbi:hypothetical protein PF008_g22091 [Phytophthora fragariae]|uniref:Uncharacterized protein n=1 Tax=Phytophthora fragariae TaxID=53985 RepID=A0A6G0QUQ7_9STRA|nr:hypothetical protein PF008_g22091 [Phytophthora fragariae]
MRDYFGFFLSDCLAYDLSSTIVESSECWRTIGYSATRSRSSLCRRVGAFFTQSANFSACTSLKPDDEQGDVTTGSSVHRFE